MTDGRLQFWLVPFGKAGDIYYIDNVRLEKVTAPVLPVITTHPAGQTIVAGQTATFSVVATGTAPLGYQWQKNGVAIPGATGSSYTTPAATPADNGANFRVVVSNAVGSATSNNAILTVNSAPVAPLITTQPLSQTVTVGQTATFSVAATGTQPLSYQWQKNGTDIPVQQAHRTPPRQRPYRITVRFSASM